MAVEANLKELEDLVNVRGNLETLHRYNQQQLSTLRYFTRLVDGCVQSTARVVSQSPPDTVSIRQLERLLAIRQGLTKTGP